MPTLNPFPSKVNPYLRGGGFKTTGDLMRGTTWQNEQADKGRYFEADQLRRTNRNPRIIAQKKAFILKAGYTPAEADVLAVDETFWRPEFEILGIKRPYNVNLNFGGTTAGKFNAFTKDVNKQSDKARYMQNVKEDLEDEKYQRKTEREIDREYQLRDTFPEDYDGRYARGGSKRTTPLNPAAKGDENTAFRYSKELQEAERERREAGKEMDALSLPENEADTVENLENSENVQRHIKDGRIRWQMGRDAKGNPIRTLVGVPSADEMATARYAVLAEKLNLENDYEMPRRYATRQRERQEKENAASVRYGTAEQKIKDLREAVKASGYRVDGETVINPITGAPYLYQPTSATATQLPRYLQNIMRQNQINARAAEPTSENDAYILRRNAGSESVAPSVARAAVAKQDAILEIKKLKADILEQNPDYDELEAEQLAFDNFKRGARSQRRYILN